MSELLVFNTLTRKKEPFKSIEPNKISMYLCGVTVYDNCHIGHARAYVVFDCIRRHLAYLGYDVNFVQNFTDIDDKIIQRANEKDVSWKALTKANIKSFFEDMDALNISRASQYPKATEHIGDMIAMIKDLMDKGIAYKSGGDVCFSVDAFEAYGKLSKKNIDELEAGSRVGVNENKRNPLDFVLWKQAKPDEPSWGSPWGKGRPGWHIECSAMVKKILGNTIDIHAGGEDLVFPHHENEIAQSECCTGQTLANYWLHNGFVKIQDEKMSKSLNNFFTIKDILKDVPGVVLRYFLTKVHYRLPINFTKDGLEEAGQALRRLADVGGGCSDSFGGGAASGAGSSGGSGYGGGAEADRKHQLIKSATTRKEAVLALKDMPALLQFLNRFDEAMNNDFNFSEAVAVLFDLAKHINKTYQGHYLLGFLLERLGLNVQELNQSVEITPDIQKVLDARMLARKNKDFTASDQLRDQLKSEFGLDILDARDGSFSLKRI